MIKCPLMAGIRVSKRAERRPESREQRETWQEMRQRDWLGPGHRGRAEHPKECWHYPSSSGRPGRRGRSCDRFVF